jgi:hypothetical protein
MGGVCESTLQARGLTRRQPLRLRCAEKIPIFEAEPGQMPLIQVRLFTAWRVLDSRSWRLHLLDAECCGCHKVLRTKPQSQRKEFKLKEKSRLKSPQRSHRPLRGHRKISRSNTKAMSDLHSKEDQQIMQFHDNTAKAHIGAESSSARSSTAKRALQQAKALRRSEITHVRWSPAFGCLVHQYRQARGGIPLVAIAVRACMPGQRIFWDFHFTNGGTGIVFLISTSPRGLRETPRPTGAIGDKLGSGMPAANADGPNSQRTLPSVR